MGARRAVPYIHCHPKTKILAYRRRIPNDARPFVADHPREFVRSLGARKITAPGLTERIKAAEAEYDLLVAKARTAAATGIAHAHDELTPTLIAFLAENYLAMPLSRDEQVQWGRPPLKVP